MSEPPVRWEIGDDVINAVITAAVWSAGQRPGTWSKMVRALNEGAGKTKEGTVNAFLFRAMIDRLLEEFRALDTQTAPIQENNPERGGFSRYSSRPGKPPSLRGGGQSTGGTPCR